uniref:Uncharacterized protein n=1 Tax=Cannabis sativa TaxID=3483 RepID=A0A803NK53_CANSA
MTRGSVCGDCTFATSSLVKVIEGSLGILCLSGSDVQLVGGFVVFRDMGILKSLRKSGVGYEWVERILEYCGSAAHASQAVCSSNIQKDWVCVAFHLSGIRGSFAVIFSSRGFLISLGSRPSGSSPMSPYGCVWLVRRGLSCPLLPPPTNTRKTNRDHSLTPKKSKSKPTSAKVSSLMMKSSSQSMVIASTNRLGPDPNDLPKALTTKKSSSSVCSVVNLVEDLHTFSGSVFSLAPPPSSLPLPRFSLKPKLSCNAEAAGIDAGATDNLRRLLRLR